MRTLIVEDDKHVREVLIKILEKEFFVVESTDNGREGLFLAKSNEYDLIILDNMLPEVGGLEVCRELRKAGKHSPVMILSVASDVNTKVEFLNSGADDYLTKPFSVNEFLARVRAVMRRPQEVKEDIICISGVELNVLNFQVKSRNKVISLTKKEFLLLHYLMKNKDHVISRTKILEHVWDRESIPLSNTIEAHVASLRKKLNFSGKHKQIIYTVPGVGYIVR